MEEGAQLLHSTLKQIEFSSQSYDDLLDLYNKEVSSETAVAGHATNESQILRSVACQWLNRLSGSGSHRKRNFERWNTSPGVKHKIKIGGIFPLNGKNYKAPELIPGM